MRAVLVPLAAMLMTGLGCATLQSLSNPAQFITEATPQVVYVTHVNRSVVPIAQPRVSGDSLFGTWAGMSRPVAMPLSEVQAVHVVQRDKRRTALLIAGLTTATAVGVYALVQAISDEAEFCDASYGAGC